MSNNSDQANHQQPHQLPQDSSRNIAAPVSPFLPTPVAPFASTPRKKAYTSAVFYGECHLQGISPKIADDAALGVQKTYNKWWVDYLFRSGRNHSIHQERTRRGSLGSLGGCCSGHQSSSSSQTSDDASHPMTPGAKEAAAHGPALVADDGRMERLDTNRKRTKRIRRSSSVERVSVQSAHTDDSQQRRRRGRRGGIRDVIDHVSAHSGSQADEFHANTVNNTDEGYGSSAGVVSLSSAAAHSVAGGDGITSASEDEFGSTTSRPAASRPLHVRAQEEHEGRCIDLSPLKINDSSSHSHDTGQQKQQPHKIHASIGSDSIAQQHVDVAKSDILSSLTASGGDVSSPEFLSALRTLHTAYASTEHDARHLSSSSRATEEGLDLDGTWLTLSRPNYRDCLGHNLDGEHMYTLGRMSFDMFRPTNLTISVQGMFNTVHMLEDGSGEGDSCGHAVPEYVPRSLRKEIVRNRKSGSRLRTYNIVSAFTIEPNQNRNGEQRHPPPVRDEGTKQTQPNSSQEHIITRPVRGIMTNFGYVLPDPNVSNRLSIFFTGGTLEVNDEGDLEEWKRIFDRDTAPKRDLSERANVLGARILLGAHVPDTMEEDGSMSYRLTRPIGGHGRAFCDVLYLDSSLRIMRGHAGTIYVFSRIGPFEEE